MLNVNGLSIFQTLYFIHGMGTLKRSFYFEFETSIAASSQLCTKYQSD